MLKNKLKINKINFRELLFPIAKISVILVSLIVFMFVLKFIYGIFNNIYSVTPTENKKAFFDLGKLKAIGPKWGVDVSGLK